MEMKPNSQVEVNHLTVVNIYSLAKINEKIITLQLSIMKGKENSNVTLVRLSYILLINIRTAMAATKTVDKNRRLQMNKNIFINLKCV